MISDWKVKNMCYRHRTKQEMTVSVQESIFRVGDHKKKWLEFKYKPNGCNVFMHATFSCSSYWQLSYGSLKLTSRNTIIMPKGLWVLVRCFLRSFHSYAKNPSAICPQLFFSTQGQKKHFHHIPRKMIRVLRTSWWSSGLQYETS